MHPAPSQILRATILTILFALSAPPRAGIKAIHRTRHRSPRAIKAAALAPLIVAEASPEASPSAPPPSTERSPTPAISAKKYGARIHAEIFENHHSKEAHREILRLLAGSNPTPNQPARIILYGHSWGASEAVNVARQLQRDGIPVLLLISVDGIPKRPQDDSIIPANVAQAINLYQTVGLLHGCALLISAADPALHPDHRQHPPHLQRQSGPYARLPLVRPNLHQTPHRNRKRPPRLEPGRSYDPGQPPTRYPRHHRNSITIYRRRRCSCLFQPTKKAVISTGARRSGETPAFRICFCICLVP